MPSFSLDPRDGIGNLPDVKRAALVEGAINMLEDHELSAEEALLIVEPPKKVSEEDIEDMGTEEFEMGYTFVEEREGTNLRIREISTEPGDQIVVADILENPNIPQNVFYPKCIFDFEGTQIYEWPVDWKEEWSDSLNEPR